MEHLNKITPLKTKFVRANHSKFVTKEVSKAIMLRTKLRNKFLKKKTAEEYLCQSYKKSKTKLLRKSRFKRH